MTGPYDDGPSGIFDHLDDPGASAPSQETLAAVVHRGRRIRARRQGAIAMSGAAAVTAAVLGGLGLAHSVNASGHDSITTPANSGTPTLSPSASARQRPPGGSVVVPHGRPASSPASPTLPPSAQPCATDLPTTSPSPLLDGPIAESSVPPLVPTASPEPCPSESPSESPSPSESESPSPEESPTEEPTSSPGVPFPSAPAAG